MTPQDNERPEWYGRLNRNEKRIVDLLIANGIQCVLSRPWLEAELCKKDGMDQRTLTDRLGYLIEKGILFEVGGDKGATGYGFNFILNNPEWNSKIGIAVDTWSPKKMKILKLGLPITSITDRQSLIDGLRKSRDSIDRWYDGSRDQKRKMKDIYNIAIEDEKGRLKERVG